MDTYYARHTGALDVDDVWVDQLWSAGRIGVHYPERRDGTRGAHDNASIDPNDHAATGAQVMRALGALAREGGYVCAEMRRHPGCMIGRVLPNTPIVPVTAEWRRSSYPEGRPAALKTVQLTAVQRLDALASATLLVGRPQRGTFTRWPSVRDTVEALVEHRPLEARLDRLSPAQQEVLCGEFLRSDAAPAMGLPRLAQQLLPAGRGLKDLDILGIASDDRMLCVQVTLSPFGEVAWKVAALRAYGGADTHRLLFCRLRDGAPAVAHGSVTVVSIDAVYDRIATLPWGDRWLDRTLRPGSGDDA